SAHHQLGGRVGIAQLHALLPCLAGSNLDNSVNCLAQTDVSVFNFPSLQEVTQPFDDICCALISAVNIGQDLFDGRQIRTISIKHELSSFRVAEDCPQRLVQLVRQRRGQGTNRKSSVHPCHLGQACAGIRFGKSAAATFNEKHPDQHALNSDHTET